MADTTFEAILKDAVARNIVFDKTKQSLNWFKKESTKFNDMTSSDLLREYGKGDLVNVTNTAVGKMYFFMYDPKHKATLPYYDLFPCIFPIAGYKDGSFLGINMHYLHPNARVKLMDALYTTENSAMPENKRLQINYGILSAASRFKYFRPCIKRYLGGHVRSRFLPVPYEQWQAALFLPVHDFQKVSASKVWAESWKKIKAS